MAAPTSQLNSTVSVCKEPPHSESVEPVSALNEPKAEEELKKEAEVRREEWRKEAEQFETDFSDMEMKIHRFPASLQGLDRRYIVPMAVSIGLYHHNSSNLQEMDKVKRVAAHHFISGSGHTFEEMYAAVLSVVGTARRCYDAKVDVGDAEFADIMFVDGCFLLQFMLVYTGDYSLPPSLLSCIRSNEACILSDIMLLENQLPWLVINSLRRFRGVPLQEFIRSMGDTLQIRGDTDMESPFLNGSYMPPHLLGIFWFDRTGSMPLSDPGLWSSMSKSISAIELGEIGINLTASKTTKFADMSVKRGLLSTEIFLPPLLLDDIRSCWLVNMMAYEVTMCVTTLGLGRHHAYQIEAVVCSYIVLLSMLMDREEDVHELRSKRLVQAELTNKETLDFFKMLAKRISDAPLYFHILAEIETYKLNRWMWIEVHRFVYKNLKPIVTLFSIVGVLVGIFKTLLSLKKQ